MKHIDLFSGIGGFSLALDNVYGKENIEHTFVENDPFCQEVLRKHWPEATIHGDIKTFTSLKTKHEIELLTASPPCQSVSQAGKRRGKEDDRWLWGEAFRIIRETKPNICILENVRGLITLERGVVFEELLVELEAIGYQTRTFIIPACAVGAPHRRDRIWIVAHSESTRTWSNDKGIREILIGNGGGKRAVIADTDDTGGRTPSSGINKDGQTVGAERKLAQRGTGGQDNNVPDTTSKGGKRREHTSGDSTRTKEGVFRRKDWEQNRTEVAQRFCQLDDGLPYRLDGYVRDETCAIMGYILLLRDNFYGTKNGQRTNKALSRLSKAITSQAFSKLLRGYGKVQKEKILQCDVHGESNDERESKPWSLLTKSEKVQRKEMQKLWHETLTTYPPYQRGLDGQCSCQFDDIVRELSSPMALAEWENNAQEAADILFSLWEKSGWVGILHEPLSALQEVWKSVTDKEVGSFRRHYYKRNDNRNPRLKALGNAVVVPLVEEILKAIKAVEDQQHGKPHLCIKKLSA